jgi:ABC-type glycerol-3-phosphate transport system substrate-binding protein
MARLEDGVPRAVSRRGFLRAAVGTTGLLLLSACGGATQAPSPTAAPKADAKPTEAAKPAAKADAKPTEAAKPAAGATTAPQAAPAAKGPVSLKGVNLTYLGWTSFIPTADAFVKKQIEEGFMKETGANVSVEFINANEIQPRMSASIQGGSGPDIVHIRDNWAHTYKESMSDLSDVVEEYKREVGELYPAIQANTNVDGQYLAFPHDNSGGVMHWRKSWFREAGAEQFPQTLEQYHEVGKKLKANGHPYGQAFGHSFGDPPGWAYGMMWGYGGREIDEQGKVAINSPETIAAVTAMKDAWGRATTRPAWPGTTGPTTGRSWPRLSRRPRTAQASGSSPATTSRRSSTTSGST